MIERLAYLTVAIPVALAGAWGLTSVASDEGPLSGRQRVAYALLGVVAGACWPLMLLVGGLLYLAVVRPQRVDP